MNCFFEPLFRPFIPEIKTHQIRIIGSRICCIMSSELPFTDRQVNRKRSGNVLRNRILNIENPGECLVEFCRPNSAASEDVDKLHGHSNLITRALDSSGKDSVYTECAAGSERIVCTTFVFRYCNSRQNDEVLKIANPT